MYAVGRLGSYITRGVYTVSGPFHPFGGAVDIIVVQQPDGSFKSSPWYVRFGKFQGVLKAKENAISISVNGVQANFHMFLDQRGQAHFLREVEGEEGEETVIYNFSSTDDEDGQDQRSGMPRKSQSCNYDGSKLIAKDEIDSSNGAILGRNKSRRARILGLVFGRRSIKENSRGEGDDGVGVSRTSSLDRAEMAADLLEVRWSTNLETTPRKRDALPFPASDMLRGMGEINVQHNDEQSEVESSGIDHPSVALEMDSCNEDLGRISNFGMEIMERTVEKTTLHISSLSTIEQDIETSIIDEIILEEKCKVISEISTNIDEPCVQNGNPDDSAEGLISEGPFLNSQTLDVLEICPSKKSDEEPVSGFPVEESGSDGVQSFIYQGTSKSSGVGSDGSSEQTQETPYLNSGGPREVHSCAETLLTTAELLTEDMVDEHTEDTKLNGETIEVCDSCAQQTYSTSPCIHSQDEVSLKLPPTKLDALTVNMDPITGSVEDAESNCLSVISGFSNSDHHLQHEKSSGEYKTMSNELGPSAESVGDSEQFYGDSGPRKEVSTNVVGNSDEEQFLFSDLDEFKFSEVHNESASLDVEGIHSLFGLETTEEVNGPYKTKGEFVSSPKKFDQEDQLAEYVRATSSPIGILKPSGFADADIERLVESLPNMRSCVDNLDADDSHLPLSQSLESKLNHVVDSHFINTDRQSVDQSVQEASKSGDTQNAEDIKNDFADPPPGDPSIAVVASGGSWIWPFSLKKSKSRDTTQQTQKDMLSSDAKADSGSKIYPEKENTMISSKTTKKMVKATTPTSEQLASLNLKEGKNVVTFTFSTAVVGKQEVDARIYLWKWDTRIVISDVDGTITKSDVLGQFMPLVGVDWSQTGVAHLFSAIKENGYQLLFLSARAISQAYHTRQFLVNLKQDGKALPDGPIVISPDGLFPSLFREVIRRAPHEFKIACLETIKALFPSDYNPFYAGFGNRDTDEISYLKVGIPRGKIFIINPKGEVAVNRRVDTKSYKSLHALVHGMFPSTASSEQEDYNSWNYWKLPPPVIDI